jgi:hypothetical protein
MTTQHRLTDRNEETKTATCAVCGPNTEIYFMPGRAYWCCKVQKRAKNRASAARRYDTARNSAVGRKSKYGVTQEQFDNMLARQDGKCAVCFTADPGVKGWHIDHDHACCPGRKSCGRCVRGLLCSNCNTALGLLGDSIERLLSAIAYLRRTDA